ncbi:MULTISPECIES: SDR family NAD(P)-dependent oxidoreductase [Enterobacter]|uniref:SDR family NAD(P)-dependent oxidoreductase n=1 Tax=Enterobacter TaxID=547 RepID=UPI0028ECBF89|nr:SDR family NAD(P)-dependent oxidoreductase [Enterobacter cloacae]HDR2753260.1 SDR family NAD(P)-dependent oxidoreductase [Enterobacter asburiae]WNT38421.1 SDR family NAD(P)-dependent oxidoreductase [Enterobacter cloacae]HDR2756676.1 SDR family NAD(P)-dependent oxidoreductase [Enterobacter asburiae]HDR2791731.1 SDR family NAD(P)-dependent oxidoreductase [Enterobacter asburiae]HDR2796672.1 SDR family NAD(P)-dependent oxidoreductase [Enterobacter asburiae]
MNEKVISTGNVAVITGAAKGIGAAAARKLARKGMKLCLFDRNRQALELLADELEAETLLVTGDITRDEDQQQLKDTVYSAWGKVNLLFNNAGVKIAAGACDSPNLWRQQIEVNLLSMVATQHIFLPEMLKMEGKGAIVNLGSKEGITTPPGFAAYNASKAAVKVLTEQLSHQLMKETGTRLTAHLLVPGYTWTDMNDPGMDECSSNKPNEAWTTAQVIEYFLPLFERGDFYIICPDNAVTSEMDAKRIMWSVQDILENRPALSRWHPDWKTAFERWMKS